LLSSTGDNVEDLDRYRYIDSMIADDGTAIPQGGQPVERLAYTSSTMATEGNEQAFN
jgi:hypothetical protein